MVAKESQLSPEEKARNSFGDSTLFEYDVNHLASFPSTSPGIFPGSQFFFSSTFSFFLPFPNENEDF